eukprot:TRINITY_DN23347_c1_g2_i1.p1 TRINITY_DN23347_c1_g2~~TRINITY_DN23347_c1_g2_i1.p1  ORF type:complete len:544 (-),score=154.50 TRINITY_DN23347_c1_g2_i1:73-1704(-)
MAPMSPAPPLRPHIGFCLQTDSCASPSARWYINICAHKLVGLPLAYSGKTASKEWILSQGLGCLQVPFDMGSFRKLKERSDGSRHTTYCIDVVFNPLIVQLFMDDDFNGKMVQYRPWVLDLVVRRIEESIGVKLSTEKVKLVKSMRYKDLDGDVPRDFAELTSERDDLAAARRQEEEERSLLTPAPAPAPNSEPLIEEVEPGGKKQKPALKKGFLSGKGAAGSLYGEDGSKEGVVPENAGDPLGYLPKKLRQSCKVVDCNSPEYQKQNEQKKAAESTNEMNKEFAKQLEKWGKANTKDRWEDDRPEGTSEPPKCKYDNDYSRFDLIEEEVEQAAPVADDRDWYFDSKGNRCKLDRQPQATGSPVASAADGPRKPAVQKGFFDKSKGSIYGPEGSSQGKKPASDMTEDEMLRELSKYMKEDEFSGALDALNLGGGNGGAGGAVGSSAKVATKPVAAAPKKAPPGYELSEVEEEGSLRLVVATPGLTAMKGVNLDVTERSASLEFPQESGLAPLQVQLPRNVEPTAVRAKFSKKTQQLTVTMPTS